MAFLPNAVPGNEKLPCLSNPIPLPESPYLSISVISVNLTAPNKQFWILADVNVFTYLINNKNIYYFCMKKCALLLL